MRHSSSARMMQGKMSHVSHKTTNTRYMLYIYIWARKAYMNENIFTSCLVKTQQSTLHSVRYYSLTFIRKYTEKCDKKTQIKFTLAYSSGGDKTQHLYVDVIFYIVYMYIYDFGVCLLLLLLLLLLMITFTLIQKWFAANFNVFEYNTSKKLSPAKWAYKRTKHAIWKILWCLDVLCICRYTI